MINYYFERYYLLRNEDYYIDIKYGTLKFSIKNPLMTSS